MTIVKYYPGCYHGWDNEGRPVYIDRIGIADVDAVLEASIIIAPLVLNHVR